MKATLVAPSLFFLLAVKAARNEQWPLPAPNAMFCPIGCMQSSSSASLGTALGYNTTAGGKASFAMGVNAQTISDPNVPGGSSCGACVATGFSTVAIGDWTTAMGSHTKARGYASTALGEGTVASTFGEVALGLYTETGDYSEEELQNHSVIPAFDENDVVLRVGIGCPKSGQLDAGGFGCKTKGPLDALRVYKSGALFLKKPNGKVVEDVQAAIEKCQTDYDDLKEEFDATKQQLGAVKEEFEATKKELDTVKDTLAKLLGRLMAMETMTAHGSALTEIREAQPGEAK
eukprot:TRINITY_DN17064_c0_g1_i1.p1 TRINITY_DN17064_c0_g1~~TRINITY_DN17064_c0_g1_i1.p1  ORF type:complete len:289 (-),score=69.62 TRINITY_DN17064_c0_g1_i1:261-1127(-)